MACLDFFFGVIVRPHVGDGWELSEAAGEGVEDADDVGGVSIAPGRLVYPCRPTTRPNGEP